MKSLWLAAFALLAACAKEQPVINRVQPNYVKKSDLIGANYKSSADDPEFYAQGTLVDVGYGAGQDGLFTSTYAQPMTRIKWSITENLLIARLAYERISNSDGKGAGKATEDGEVVAAYAINSHFDIKYGYNPQTGELNNVVEENITDLPWSEREYIRVDWSKNLSTDNYDYDTLSQMGLYGGVQYEPIAYYVNDPDSPDAPHNELANGYLDVTTKAWAKPGMIELNMWGMGSVPACWLDADFSGGSAPATGCSPVELTIRQAFRKVTDTDYEPQDWDGFRFQAFGAFTTDRDGYARNYGMTDTQWHRFINRYNIWERSHAYTDAANLKGETACYTPSTTPAGKDPHRDENGDGTEDECSTVGAGSKCDAFKQRCTLSLAQRKEKPVVWYYAEGSKPEYFEATQLAALEWDVALRGAVTAGRYAECVRTGGADCGTKYPMYSGQMGDEQDLIDLAREVESCRAGKANGGTGCDAFADSIGAARGYSAGVIALAKQPEMVVLCHSPVEQNDHALCGTPRLPAGVTAAQCDQAALDGDAAKVTDCHKALTVRRGDIRYHQVNGIRAPQTPSPWGIMVDANDPLTGEVVSASINVWSHVTDLWSQGIVDTARYIKGELTTADITEGTYVRDWAGMAKNATRSGVLEKFTVEQRDERIADAFGVDKTELKARLEGFRAGPIAKQVKQKLLSTRAIAADATAPSTTRPTYEARRKHALDSPTEAALITKAFQQFATNGNSKVDVSQLTDFISPLRGANPSVQRNFRNFKELALSNRGACVMNEAPTPFAIADLASVLEQKFGNFDKNQDRAQQLERAESMRQYLARRAHYAVITHEMGHSIGLRHNFVGSSDAFNYRPQYWQLRTNNGTNTTQCTTLDPAGSCVGPRYFDPVTDNERNNLLTMFMQSTTMDYAGEGAQDAIGLGAYDFAAARMFYGDVVSVFRDEDKKLGSKVALGALNKMDSFGGILGFSPSIGNDALNGTDDIHYTQLQKAYGLISGCADVDVTKFKPTTWDDAKDGQWSPLFDGLIVSVNGQASRCHQLPVDYVAWGSMRTATDSEGANGQSENTVDPQNRVRFPYGFATDRWADLGNLSVYRHDNGADAYEIFDFLITQQETNHIFDNYRRNRRTFSVRTAANRQLERYNEKVRDGAKGLGLYATIYRDFAVASGYDYDTLWPVIGAEFFPDNLLASTLAFDHFTSQMSTPQAGDHFRQTANGETVLRAAADSAGNAGTTVVTVPNGATGYFGNVSRGGRPLENALSSNKGEYDSEYTINAGAYYMKAYTTMLMTESVDNFISASRRDFLDARYRAVSMADIFPDGYRRWLANNLTGDDTIRGSRMASSASGVPMVDADRFPASGVAHLQWWKPSPSYCFPSASAEICGATPANSVAVEPQVGWEQQKFLIAWTLMYLPENAQQNWLNQLDIWEVGVDTDPGFSNRIELHLPDGKVFVARTYGKETILGKSVQKGVGARILEWANTLLNRAYVCTGAPDTDGDGQPDWYVPTLVNGKATVKFDPNTKAINPDGTISNTGRPGCNSTDSSQCTCSSNASCVELGKYQEVPFFMRQAMKDYGLADPSMKGVYGG
ncbi:MAG: hypothetical protein IPJ65_18015 [Archangiaceae bacterium]|nr:hypothetical protein [Archangiaceae bacterium]